MVLLWSCNWGILGNNIAKVKMLLNLVLFGGIVGGVAGGVIGNKMDKQAKDIKGTSWCASRKSRRRIKITFKSKTW